EVGGVPRRLRPGVDDKRFPQRRAEEDRCPLPLISGKQHALAGRAAGEDAICAAIGQEADIRPDRGFVESRPAIRQGSRRGDDQKGRLSAERSLCHRSNISGSKVTRCRLERHPRSRARTQQAMTYVIVEPCIGVKDASCVDVCPVDCIHAKDEDTMYFIDPEECIDCGACEPECPVTAIFAEDAVPDQWQNYIQINADYFAK